MTIKFLEGPYFLAGTVPMHSASISVGNALKNFVPKAPPNFLTNLKKEFHIEAEFAMMEEATLRAKLEMVERQEAKLEAELEKELEMEELQKATLTTELKKELEMQEAVELTAELKKELTAEEKKEKEKREKEKREKKKREKKKREKEKREKEEREKTVKVYCRLSASVPKTATEYSEVEVSVNCNSCDGEASTPECVKGRKIPEWMEFPPPPGALLSHQDQIHGDGIALRLYSVLLGIPNPLGDVSEGGGGEYDLIYYGENKAVSESITSAELQVLESVAEKVAGSVEGVAIGLFSASSLVYRVTVKQNEKELLLFHLVESSSSAKALASLEKVAWKELLERASDPDAPNSSLLEGPQQLPALRQSEAQGHMDNGTESDATNATKQKETKVNVTNIEPEKPQGNRTGTGQTKLQVDTEEKALTGPEKPQGNLTDRTATGQTLTRPKKPQGNRTGTGQTKLRPPQVDTEEKTLTQRCCGWLWWLGRYFGARKVPRIRRLSKRSKTKRRKSAKRRSRRKKNGSKHGKRLKRTRLPRGA